MILRRFGVALTVALAVTLLPLSVATADETLAVVTSDVSSYPDVRLVVAAPPQIGSQTLDASAFRVVEDGELRPVQVQALPADQLEVALVVDTSGSINGAPLTAAKAAAQSFLNQLPPTVPVAVVGFGATPAVVSARSTNRPAQLSAVAGLRAGGETALYDALQTAVTQLPAGSGARRVIVLLSDGGDTASKTTLAATTRALTDARVPLFAIELVTAESNRSALTALTAAGGMVAAATDPAALGGAFDAIVKQLVRQYAVTYSSQGQGQTDVDVVLEAQGVRATARQRVELPSTPAVVSGSDPSEAPGDSPATGAGPWALLGGIALCGAAMLGFLLLSVGQRTPRARGLAGSGRRAGLAGAADRADALGDTLLKRRHRRALSEALESAGIDVRPGEFAVGVALVGLLVLAVGAWLIGLVVGLVLAAVVPVVARITLDQLARRRRNQFSEQLAETLQTLAGSLRAGHGLAQAVDTVAREAESPTAEEFGRLTMETRLGRDFVEALLAMAERVGSDDFRWAVQAVEIQREVGGDLAEIFDTVGDTIRDRTRVRRQVSALSAEGRISAWVLMILPFALAGIVSISNPEYMRPLYSSGRGLALIAAGVALLVVGGLWLRRIVKPIF